MKIPEITKCITFDFDQTIFSDKHDKVLNIFKKYNNKTGYDTYLLTSRIELHKPSTLRHAKRLGFVFNGSFFYPNAWFINGNPTVAIEKFKEYALLGLKQVYSEVVVVDDDFGVRCLASGLGLKVLEFENSNSG